jgi:uncharacterized protein YegL
METMKTYVALILDSSGSMEIVKDKTRNDFNEQLQMLKDESNNPANEAKKVLMAEDPENVTSGIETRVTVVTFNNKVNFVDFDVDVHDISEITEDEYRPGGGTALYDAIGMTIDKFNDHYDFSDPNTGVLFVILTDGEENSSQKYMGKEGNKIIKDRIDELKNTGKWTFTFMGTEDALKYVGDFAFSKAAYVQSFDGMEDMKLRHMAATKSYFAARSMGETAVADFYGQDKEEE